jgi:Lon protease-like protein
MHIPLFPLGNPLFPDGVMHLQIFEVRYLDMIKKSIANETPFGVVPLLSGREVRTPESGEVLAAAGTLARIDEWAAPMAGLMQLRCSGTQRFRLTSTEQGKFGLWMGEAELIEPEEIITTIPGSLMPTVNALGKLIADMQHRGVPVSQMPIGAPYRLDEAGWVANRWCELLPLPVPESQALLLEADPVIRLQNVQAFMNERGLLS